MTDLSIIENLRLDPTLTDGLSAKVPISIAVTKPSKHDWIRVHPTDSLAIGAIDIREDREGLYVVGKEMVTVLGNEMTKFTLHPYVNRLGVLRLWPVRLPDPDGRQNEWHRTAAMAAAMARTAWVRVSANAALGGYEVFRTETPIADPVWPELSLEQMLKIAFVDRGRVINDLEHPVVRLLQGRL